jgi:cytochrome c oxidase cbb3-type subunit III
MKRLPRGVVALLVALTACERLPGRPAGGDPATEPVAVAPFDVLYTDNCAGCHGANGLHGAALSLNDPAYLAIQSDSALTRVTAHGVPGTLMPAFSRSAGGTLADAEVAAIVHGIRTTWGRGETTPGAPPLTATAIGDTAAGAQAYATFCARCHRANDGPTDASYLALVSNQWLRTTIIVGRPELGMPDWRGDVPGRPLTEREIADIVAWLAAHRVPFPGQPYHPQS